MNANDAKLEQRCADLERDILALERMLRRNTQYWWASAVLWFAFSSFNVAMRLMERT